MQDGWDGPSRQVSTYILKDSTEALNTLRERAHAHPGWRPFFRPVSSPLFVCWEAAEGILAGSGVRAPQTDREQGCWGRWGPLLSTSVPPVQAPCWEGGHTDCHQLDQPQQVGRPPHGGWMGGRAEVLSGRVPMQLSSENPSSPGLQFCNWVPGPLPFLVKGTHTHPP